MRSLQIFLNKFFNENIKKSLAMDFSNLINDCIVMGRCLVVHTPATIDEFQLTILNKSGNLKNIFMMEEKLGKF
jgi:hypothetical protein